MTIRYTLNSVQERNLRIAYVNSDNFNYIDPVGYGDYVIANIPGAIGVEYQDNGDNSNYIDSVLFEDNQLISLFVLRYS